MKTALAKPTLTLTLTLTFTLTLLLTCFTARSQDYGVPTVQLYLQINDSKGAVVPYVFVYLIDSGTGEEFTAVSDNKGKAAFTPTCGVTYTINFKDSKNHDEITIPMKGMSFMTRKVVYDGKTTATEADVSMAAPDTVVQLLTAKDKSDRSQIKVMIKFSDKFDNPLPDYKIRCRSYKINKVYVAKTNNQGVAYFLLPINHQYDIGIDVFDAYQEVSVPNKPGITVSHEYKYQPTVVSEKNINDTITQEFPVEVGATSLRAFVGVFIKSPAGIPLPNEIVCLDAINEGKVYYSVTNDMGMAFFLLPKGDKYTLHFKYDRNVDLMDYSNKNGVHQTMIEYTYVGSEAIEAYYQNASRDKGGFQVKFEESSIERLPECNYTIEKTAAGYNIQFERKEATSPPAVGGARLFMNGGFYSRDLYCIDPLTGRYIWGVELQEGGISATVYDSEVVLANTESCTLYAIDAKTGDLLWSKWLSPYLFTTPTVDNGKVFAVYGNDLSSYEPGANDKKFVLACMDLKTGNILWQNWLDYEALAAPVSAGGKVYVTTLAGSLYQFDHETGKLGRKLVINATTMPTIVDDKLYVCTKHNDAKITESVEVYKVKDMLLYKNFDLLSGKYHGKDLGKMYSCVGMNYNGPRIMYYKGKNYNVMNDRLICSSPEDGSIIWSADLTPERIQESGFQAASMPVVIGGKIVICTQKGKIRFYDPETGQMLKEYVTESELWVQPVAYNGWLYSGNMSGNMVSINTGDKTVAGWNMWGLNASHNTVVK